MFWSHEYVLVLSANDKNNGKLQLYLLSKPTL